MNGLQLFWFEETLSATIQFQNKVEVEIKYLHQLQNLYFSLTGKELEIKL
jgi:hypothetical protein